MNVIDLRSDTVTLPSPEMRRFILDAEVGDDVYGEDTTVNALQEKAAELLGKEAALFVSSGTMGNLIAHIAWCNAGDEVICGEKHHTLNSEQANAARGFLHVLLNAFHAFHRVGHRLFAIAGGLQRAFSDEHHTGHRSSPVSLPAPQREVDDR